MRQVRVKLVKLRTDDGMIDFEDHIELGKLYEVDMDTLRSMRGFNLKHGLSWKRDMVQEFNHDPKAVKQWFPIECIDAPC